ncbi:maleylacetoacetate isomerase [Alterisphingorhabdus coralli]|uniref:Maleylacetoacetate isomerase n=1 Tax=Alterisphingorhabdus coralli TaxID=3071408 RepID=A0AA97F630_9SPHN|nr:maleylacetoacetate isomerase [Parasphingorhabdus sp. SCSIO 66989]WOE74626.1 maleylacetoacetate isomerase [Parasphingorhabdus sp. SCSIO 66989]
MSEIVLYDYFRSTAAYRVRLALNLKGVAYRTEWVNLVDGDQRSAAYTARNPQGLVPMLHIDGHDLSQSLAIIDYLDARFPEPRMLPEDPAARARVLADAMAIIADIHPINNLRVWQYLKDPFYHSQDDVVQWMHHWMTLGYTALEQAAPELGVFGGETPNLTDICLTAQMYNAERFELAMESFPKLARIHAELGEHEAFKAAHPDRIAPE